jgi:hypothetical protein
LFHPITDEDLDTIWTLQHGLRTLGSEYDAFRLYAWKPLDRSQVAFWRNAFALRCMMQGEPWYLAPPKRRTFTDCWPPSRRTSVPPGGKTLYFLHTQDDGETFPEGFTATPRRDLYDYVYRAEDLTTLGGRAYAAKRNQISQFKRRYDWRFEPLSSANRDAVLAIADEWDRTHTGALLAYERTAIERMLALPRDYGQSGGVLFADGKPAAFAIGSHPRPALLDIEIEKALPAFTGAYSMIIQSYAQYAYSLDPFEYINREEDMGLDNLREAKLQLKPVRLIEKTLMTAKL